MNNDLYLLPYIQTNLVVFLVAIIFILWLKIPSRRKQREEGERLLAKRVSGNHEEVKREFEGYFGRIFWLLSSVSALFLMVNVLLAIAINIFIMSQPNDPVFTKVSDWPLLNLPPMVVSAIIAFAMCSGGWLMIISLFFHNRAAKLSLEIKYESFFKRA